MIRSGAGGSVMKMPLAGGATTELAIASGPRAIAVDGTNVYWTNDGSNGNQVADGAVMKWEKTLHGPSDKASSQTPELNQQRWHSRALGRHLGGREARALTRHDDTQRDTMFR